MAVLRLSHLTDFSYIDEVYDERKGCLSKRWILMIPGSGCQWAKEKKGGCYMWIQASA